MFNSAEEGMKVFRIISEGGERRRRRGARGRERKGMEREGMEKEERKERKERPY